MKTCYCDFCNEFNHSQKSDRIIWENDDFALFPTIGTFIEGYCLFIPKTHVTSFAQLSEDKLISAYSSLQFITNIITKTYSSPVIIAEHGSIVTDCGASCVQHAHLHLIPINNPLSILKEYIQVGNNPIFFENFTQLRNYSNQPYIYFAYNLNKNLVWENVSNFSKQFVRRVCAAYVGLENFFNWRIYPFNDNLKSSRDKLIDAINDSLFTEKVA